MSRRKSSKGKNAGRISWREKKETDGKVYYVSGIKNPPQRRSEIIQSGKTYNFHIPRERAIPN